MIRDDFASVFAVALLVGGIYLIATGHPSGGYALAGTSVLSGFVVMTLLLVAVLWMKRGIGDSFSEAIGDRFSTLLGVQLADRQ